MLNDHVEVKNLFQCECCVVEQTMKHIVKRVLSDIICEMTSTTTYHEK